jgi:hypothetical protein
MATGDRMSTDTDAGAARLRPALPSRSLPALTTSLTSSRSASGVPAEEPKKKAQSILDALPGNSLVSKTAILSSTAGLGIYALSNEYYVVNEETIVAFCLLSIWTAIFKYGGPMYKEWADGQVNKIKGILNAARADHTEAVKTRIESVQQLGGVVDITKTLFEVSKVRDNGASNLIKVLTSARKPQSLRLRHTSLNRPPPLPQKPNQSWIHGFDMRGRSRSANRRNWQRVLSPRSKRSLKTPRSSSRSCNRVLLMLRVSDSDVFCSLLLLM